MNISNLLEARALQRWEGFHSPGWNITSLFSWCLPVTGGIVWLDEKGSDGVGLIGPCSSTCFTLHSNPRMNNWQTQSHSLQRYWQAGSADDCNHGRNYFNENLKWHSFTFIVIGTILMENIFDLLIGLEVYLTPGLGWVTYRFSSGDKKTCHVFRNISRDQLQRRLNKWSPICLASI